MKKTHIIATLLFALPLVVLTSCLKDDKDVFDESASTRMQEQLTNTRKILMGAKDGWVMDYYYGDDQANGSKVFIIKFDSLECTAMSEFTGDKSSTSYYKLTNDNGPVLTFDTYNDVLHNLATPSSTDYEGQHADFEMVVMSATPERVVLKGKKTNDYMYLYPLSGSATDYIANVTAMSENLIVGTAVGKTVDGDSIVGTFNTDSRYITFTNASDTSFHKKVPYTYTDKGLRLYEDVQLGSTTVSSFVYDEENSTLTSNNFKFECRMPEGWMPYADFAGSYKLYCDDGETQTTYDVSLVPQADGKTYHLEGLNDKYDISLTYKKSNGALFISYQKLATVGSVDLALCMLDKSGSTLTWATDCGMYFKSAGTDKPGVLNIVPNEYEDLTAGSIILWIFEDGEAYDGTQVRSWFDSHTQYYFTGGRYYLPNMKTMEKVNN